MMKSLLNVSISMDLAMALNKIRREDTGFVQSHFVEMAIRKELRNNERYYGMVKSIIGEKE